MLFGGPIVQFPSWYANSLTAPCFVCHVLCCIETSKHILKLFPCSCNLIVLVSTYETWRQTFDGERSTANVRRRTADQTRWKIKVLCEKIAIFNHHLASLELGNDTTHDHIQLRRIVERQWEVVCDLPNSQIVQWLEWPVKVTTFLQQITRNVFKNVSANKIDT